MNIISILQRIIFILKIFSQGLIGKRCKDPKPLLLPVGVDLRVVKGGEISFCENLLYL